MEKRTLKSNLAYYQGQMTSVYGQINALETARRQLLMTGTNVDYTLKSHEHIKESYHLAGTPYLEMTHNEEALIQEIETYFKSQKEFFLNEIDRKIAHHQLTISSYNRSILALQIALTAAEED